MFRVDHYYLSHLLLSSETTAGKILVASEVHTAAEYFEHIYPFMNAYGRDGVLKFSVQDKVPRKEPSDRRSERSQAPMDVDDSEEPITSSLPASGYTSHRPHRQFGRHHWLSDPRHRYPNGSDDSINSDRWPHPRPRPRSRGRPYFPNGRYNHRSSRREGSPSRHIRHAEEHEDASRHANTTRGHVRDELERIWSNPPHVALNTAGPPPSFRIPEPSAKEEVSQLINTFVDEFNNTLTKHGMSEHTLSVASGSETARSEAATPTPVVAEDHPGYHCDYCRKPVRGIRHKVSNLFLFHLVSAPNEIFSVRIAMTLIW